MQIYCQTQERREARETRRGIHKVGKGDRERGNETRKGRRKHGIR